MEQISDKKIFSEELSQMYRSLKPGTIIEVYDTDTNKELIKETRINWRTGNKEYIPFEFQVFTSPTGEIALKVRDEKITRKNKEMAIEGEYFLNSIANAIFDEGDGAFAYDFANDNLDIDPNKLDLKIYFKIVTPDMRSASTEAKKDDNTARIEKFWSQRVELAKQALKFIEENRNRPEQEVVKDLADKFANGMPGNIIVPNTSNWYLASSALKRTEGMLNTVIVTIENEVKDLEEKLNDDVAKFWANRNKE
jgi:hypothetical protein